MKLLMKFVILFSLQIVRCDGSKYCTTASCVHAAANVLEKLNTDIDPCEDFYRFACGNFDSELGVPDEKTTIDTLVLIKDRVIEYVLTLVDSPFDSKESRIHRLTKSFYNGCLDTGTYRDINVQGSKLKYELIQGRINTLSKQPLEHLLNDIGGWPMLSGNVWNESSWSLDRAVNELKSFIKKPLKEEINAPENDVDTSESGFSSNEFAQYKVFLKHLIRDVVKIMGTNLTDEELSSEIDELLSFEEKLDEFSRKFRIFKLTNKRNKELTKYNKHIIWMNHFQEFLIADKTAFEGKIEADLDKMFLKFLDMTTKRTLANFVSYRVALSGLLFLGDNFKNALLSFEKSTSGKEDVEQRWKFCAAVLSEIAPVAVGSLYVNEYFKPEDKAAAEIILNQVIEAYVENVKNISWLDTDEKAQVVDYTSKILKFIGYHELLETKGTSFYDKLAEFSQDEFFKIGISIKIFNAERKFTLLGLDWSKYSQPQTVNAFFNSKDSSIQFPAGILQDPNFDPNRPASMNFGALGGIISHEVTHSFDLKVSSFKSKEKVYGEKLKCIVNQYSSYRVKEVEEAYQIKEFHLNGNATLKEDIADTGAVKIAFDAYKSWMKKNPPEQIPIGLNNFTLEQIFWIAHAQTFCAFERVSRSKSKVETGIYSLEYFRIFGPLSNSNDFAKSFGCSATSKMFKPDEQKCSIW